MDRHYFLCNRKHDGKAFLRSTKLVPSHELVSKQSKTSCRCLGFQAWDSPWGNHLRTRKVFDIVKLKMVDIVQGFLNQFYGFWHGSKRGKILGLNNEKGGKRSKIISLNIENGGKQSKILGLNIEKVPSEVLAPKFPCNEIILRLRSSQWTNKTQRKLNQSRICGKGVGLGFFPSDSLQSQSHQFIGIAHIGPYYGVKNDCRNFLSNRMNSFSKNQKKVEKWLFFRPFLG